MLECSIAVYDRRATEGLSVRTKHFATYQDILKWVATLKLPPYTQVLVLDASTVKTFPVIHGKVHGIEETQ